MDIIKNLMNRFGMMSAAEAAELRKEISDIKTKASDWTKLFNIGQEWRLFGDKVTRPYDQIASVYKAVKAISDNVPQADLIFRDKKSKKTIDDDEIVVLFNNPNPLMTETDFIQAWVGFYSLYGESFVVKETSVGQMVGTKKLPAELWVFNPSEFQEVTDNARRVLKWRYNKESREFDVNEVIHMRDFNPYSLFRGLSPTEPISKIIDIDWQTLVYNKAFFENGAVPGLMLSTDQRLSQDVVDRLRQQIDARHKGASNAFKIAIFEAGLKALDVGSSHKEMDFIEQKRFAREEIYGIWKVPKAMFSITDDLNYATFIGQMKMFWNYTIMPALKKVESSINVHLVNAYNPKIEAAFDLSGVIAYQEDFKEKADTATKLFAMGFTRNEINKKLELGFEDQPWGDVWWVPFGQVPADADAAISNNEPQDPQQSDTGKSFDDMQKLTYWQAFLVKQAPVENRMADMLRRYFFEQRKVALEAMNTLGADGFKINWDEQDEVLKNKAKPYLYLGIKEGISFAKEMLNQKSAAYKDDNARVTSYLVMRADKITHINRTVKDQIKTSIEEGVLNGETVTQLSDRIRSVYNMASARSLMIARTETTGAVNGGSQIYYEDAGVQQKKWLTARDEHVRLSHQHIEGEVVGMNDDFSIGLSYPGDMKGLPEETINCRCTITPVIR